MISRVYTIAFDPMERLRLEPEEEVVKNVLHPEFFKKCMKDASNVNIYINVENCKELYKKLKNEWSKRNADD